MRYFSLLCLVFLVGCSSPTEPVPLPPGSVPMDPVPDNYAEWYADVEGCMGAEGDYLQGGSKHPVPPFAVCDGTDPAVYAPRHL